MFKKDEKVKIIFSKVKDGAKIPSKRDEDMGYDLYPCFEEDFIEIDPHTTRLIPTGIAMSVCKDYGFIIKPRGSLGAKGLDINAGVVDSGFKGEVFVALANNTDKIYFISKVGPVHELKVNDDEQTFEIKTECVTLPYEKAIAQALVIPVPQTEIIEMPYEEFMKIETERGTGMLGSSGK